jgi:hypothetical protein
MEKQANEFKAMICYGSETIETTAKKSCGHWLVGGDYIAAYPKGTTVLIRTKEKNTGRWAWYRLKGMFLKFQDFTGED